MKTRELTIVFLYQPENEEYDEAADLVSVSPKGTENEKNSCDYCEGNEDAPAKGALCDAHAVEQSIKCTGCLFWLKLTLGDRTGKEKRWLALKEALINKRVTIVGRNCWMEFHGPDGYDHDERFEVSTVTVEDDR